ncbi:MAG: hypothetical protein ACPG32_10455, partial [Akkermansiaceae bacterium]
MVAAEDTIFSERVQAFLGKEPVEPKAKTMQEVRAHITQYAQKHGFELFAPEGHRSLSLTTISNNRGLDVAGFIKRLREKHGFLINGGYGKIKGTTFRISNMGNETFETMQELIHALDDVIEEFSI